MSSWLFQYFAQLELLCYFLCPILYLLTYVILFYISPYISCYSWPPIIPCNQFCHLPSIFMSCCWHIMMYPDYLSSQLFIFQHIHLSFLQHQISFYLPFISFYYFYSCLLYFFYYSNYFLVLTSSLFYFF